MSMKKPDGTFPLTPKSTPQFMPPMINDPSIRGTNFDQLLKNRGIKFLHRRAIPCPNLRVLNDNTHDPNCTFCDNSGILYYGEREIVGIFSGNSNQKQFEQQGMWEIGTAVVTFPAEYTDGTQADFNEFDQVLIQDFEVRLWEQKDYEPRDNGQRLRYPITTVEYLASVENGVLTQYQSGVDYNIVDGKIKWVSGKEPAYDTINERGSVFVAAYYAKPVYTVIQTLRELRVTQEYVDGIKVARRLPQEVQVRRDFLPQQAEKISD